MTDPTAYPIQLEPTARYFYWSQIYRLVFPLAILFGVGVALALIYALTIGRTLPHRQAKALAISIDGDTLRVDSGVYFVSRKSIPLDRVTDFALDQGPILRRCGIWALRIQTAGAGSTVAEATIVGLANPERVRDELLRVRDASVKRTAS